VGVKRCGRTCADERLRLEGMLWVLRTGVGWRDLPARFGPWRSVYAVFRSWTHSGLWQTLLTVLSNAARDDEYLMIDSTAMRVHAHGSNPAGGQLAQAMARSRASLSTKAHFACDALGYPLGFILTGANVPDCDQAKPLLAAHLRADAHVIMDKGYDSDALRAYVNQHGGVAVIAVNASRSAKPAFDEHLYRARHCIENLFARLKSFRRLATRYEKLHSSFAAMLSLACILLWLRF
jgi:transposase